MDEFVNLFLSDSDKLMPVKWPKFKRKVILEAPFMFLHNQTYSSSVSVANLLESQETGATQFSN